MNSLTFSWIGASHKVYTYYIHPIDTVFAGHQVGNYIFCKFEVNRWKAIYIGEGDIKTRTEAHRSEGCVIKKGASHIHVHNNSNALYRKSEEEDLLKNYAEAYVPIGCNMKKGG